MAPEIASSPEAGTVKKCPKCDRTFKGKYAAQGLGRHLALAHGIKGSSNTAKYRRLAKKPKNGRRKGMQVVNYAGQQKLTPEVLKRFEPSLPKGGIAYCPHCGGGLEVVALATELERVNPKVALEVLKGLRDRLGVSGHEHHG